MGSLLMFKKKEEDEILKNQKLPSEVGLILKFICYLLDEKFDENMNEKEMFENIVKNILDKNDDKTFKGLLVNYFNKNKFLNLTQEKVDNINKIVNENNKILVMTEISKSCRPFSLFRWERCKPASCRSSAIIMRQEILTAAKGHCGLFAQGQIARLSDQARHQRHLPRTAAAAVGRTPRR